MPKRWTLLMVLALLLAACGTNSPSLPANVIIANNPDWLKLGLVNARIGEAFALADFAGKTVYVEPMATWCINCRRQMQTLIEVKDQLAQDDIVLVGISVEIGLEASVLAEYVNTQGFDWTFAVASPELAEAFVTQFGRTALNPPTTPHFTISPDGAVTQLHTGYLDAAQMTAWLTSITGS
jgi:thiol-disulfide isomerase/thioredoxin